MSEHLPSEAAPILLLSDAPSRTDRFGAHGRVAKAIAEVIESERGAGRSLGLEGAWGSGKSSIVRMVLDHLHAEQKTVAVIVDAWAHQGDPLRRVFLQSVFEAISKNETWFTPSTSENSERILRVWKKRFRALAGEVRTLHQRTVPRVTNIGIALLVSALLVPLGLALVASLLNRGILSGLRWEWSPDWPSLVWVTVGLVLSLGPLLIALYALLAKKTSVAASREFVSFSTRQNETFSRVETSTPNPTSLEFEKAFSKLVSDFLTKDRTIVIVLDNLDRVDAHTRRDILSTVWSVVQSQQRIIDLDTQPEGSLWFLLVYDPSRIDSNQQLTTDQEFLDKLLHARFVVPPLVTPDWRKGLVEYLSNALPDVADQVLVGHAICNLYDAVVRPSDLSKGSPTPRDLKHFVNQIGILYRQWRHDVALQDIAYFVCLKLRGTTNGGILQGLRLGTLPEDTVRTLVTLNCREDLACLLFGMPRNVSQVVLLEEMVRELLISGQFEELDQHSSRPGFFEALEAGLRREALLSLPHLLATAHWFQTRSGFSLCGAGCQQTIRDTLVTSFLRQTQLEDMSPPIGRYLADLVSLFPDDSQLRRHVDRVLRNSLANIASINKVGAQDACVRWCDMFVAYLRHIEIPGVQKASTVPPGISGQANREEAVAPHDVGIRLTIPSMILVYTAVQFTLRDPDGQFWERLILRSSDNSGANELFDHFDHASSWKNDQGLLEYLTNSEVNIDWVKVELEINQRLMSPSEYSHAKVTTAYRMSWALSTTRPGIHEAIANHMRLGMVNTVVREAQIGEQSELAAWALLSYFGVTDGHRRAARDDKETIELGPSLVRLLDGDYPTPDFPAIWARLLADCRRFDLALRVFQHLLPATRVAIDCAKTLLGDRDIPIEDPFEALHWALLLQSMSPIAGATAVDALRYSLTILDKSLESEISGQSPSLVRLYCARSSALMKLMSLGALTIDESISDAVQCAEQAVSICGGLGDREIQTLAHLTRGSALLGKADNELHPDERGTLLQGALDEFQLAYSLLPESASAVLTGRVHREFASATITWSKAAKQQMAPALATALAMSQQAVLIFASDDLPFERALAEYTSGVVSLELARQPDGEPQILLWKAINSFDAALGTLTEASLAEYSQTHLSRGIAYSILSGVPHANSNECAQQAALSFEISFEGHVRMHNAGQQLVALEALVDLHLRHDAASEALEWADRAITQTGDAISYLWRAEALLKLERTSEALEALGVARAKDAPEHLIDWIEGEIARETCDFPKALDSFRHSVQLHPSFSQSYFSLALTFAMLGQGDDALTHCALGLRHCGTPQEITVVINKLLSIEALYGATIHSVEIHQELSVAREAWAR